MFFWKRKILCLTNEECCSNLARASELQRFLFGPPKMIWNSMEIVRYQNKVESSGIK